MSSKSRYDHLASFKPTGDKLSVVIEIGTAYTKVGYASELVPRAIVPSRLDDERSGLHGPVLDFRRPPELQRRFLKAFLYRLYYEYLILEPKSRRLVIVESVLAPTEFRNALASVLFTDFEVPSVLFAPSHLLATFPLGISTALVLDVGYSEALLIPVYESVSMLSSWQSSTAAGARALHNRLKDHLIKDGASEERLTEDALEDIKVRGCFVTKPERGAAIQAMEANPEGLSKPPPGFTLNGVPVSGLAREGAAESMFTCDADDRSLPQLILDALLKLPVDMRREMASKILVVGGGSMLPGFRSRLKAELARLVASDYAGRLHIPSFAFFSPRCPGNYASWLGGSVFGALETLPQRSLAREEWELRPSVPDWCDADAVHVPKDRTR